MRSQGIDIHTTAITARHNNVLWTASYLYPSKEVILLAILYRGGDLSSGNTPTYIVTGRRSSTKSASLLNLLRLTINGQKAQWKGKRIE